MWTYSYQFNYLCVYLFWNIKKQQKEIQLQYLKSYEIKYDKLYKKFQEDNFTCVKPLPRIKSLCWETRNTSDDTLSFSYKLGDLNICYSAVYPAISFNTPVSNILTLLFIVEMYSLNNNHKLREDTIYSSNEMLLLDYLHSKHVNQVRLYDHAHKPIDINDYSSLKTSLIDELDHCQLEADGVLTPSIKSQVRLYLFRLYYNLGPIESPCDPTLATLHLVCPLKNFVYLYKKTLVLKKKHNLL